MELRAEDLMTEVFEPFEVQYDPDTGELVKDQEIIITDLPRVARRLAVIDRKSAVNAKTIDYEIERLRGVKQRMFDKYATTRSFLMSRCEHLMRQGGKDELEYPGIGKFRYGTTRESVNDTVFESLDKVGKGSIQREYPGMFRIKVEAKPDKKAILAHLKTDDALPGFTLNRKYQKFEFKPEV